MIQLDLPTEIEARLKELADATGHSMSQIAREAIISKLEDIEDILIAEKRLADHRAGRDDPTPLSELMAEHGVED